MLKIIFSRRLLVTFFFGFSSGLPLLAIGGTLQAWLKDEGIDLETIGLLTLVGLPYTLKFIWAPVCDKYIPPFLGRRRGWAIFTQILLICTFFLISFFTPGDNLTAITILALLTSLFSATQDIVLDAHRRDTLEDNELGLGSSLFITGYRIGMLVSGALALILSDHIAWQQVYQIISICMIVGCITSLMSPEPEVAETTNSISDAILQPFFDLFKKSGFIWILLFILLYKFGDSLASAMTTPYILEMEYSRTMLGTVAKGFGLFATIAGGLFGGWILLKANLKTSLFVFGILQALSTVCFALLNHLPVGYYSLAFVIAFENLASGMGTAAFVAFMAAQTNKKFSATQYALLTSIIAIPRTFLSASTGYLATGLGWDLFFIFCTLIAIPGLLLIKKI